MPTLVDTMTELLRKLEWSAVGPTAEWRCCPICSGINPSEKQRHDYNPWVDSAYGHRASCELQAAILKTQVKAREKRHE